MSILENIYNSSEIPDAEEDSSKILFENEEQIRDLAVKLALSGKGLNFELERIKGFYDRKEKPIEQQLDGTRNYFNEQISQRRKAIHDERKLQDRKEQELSRVYERSEELAKALDENRSKKSTAWLNILQQRNEKGKSFFEAQVAKTQLGFNQDWEQIKHTLDKQQQIEKQIYEIQKENYKVSQQEYERRALKCEEEQKKTENKLEKLSEQLDNLAVFGATRFSAKFLLIVGILSLVGAGTVVANLLQGRSPGPDLLTWILSRFGFLLKSISPGITGIGSVALLAVSLVFSVVAFLCVLYLVIRISYYLKNKFEKSFETNDSTTKKERNSNEKRISRNNEKTSFYTQLSGLLKNSQGLKSYFDFLSTEISVKDYSNLIASFPFIFLIAIFVILLSASSGDKFSLSTSYIGIVIILLSASCCVLYTTKIIEPRWARYLQSVKLAEGKNLTEPVSFVKLNIEIAFLVFLLIACLALASIVPSGDFASLFTEGGWHAYFLAKPDQYFVWGAVAIFVSLSSFGLAYGVVLYGIYGNYDYLARRRDLLRLWVEKYRTQPTIGGDEFYNYQYPVDWVNDEIERLHSLRDFETWYEMNDVLGEDIDFRFPPETDAYSRLSGVVYRGRDQILKFLRRKTDLTQVILPGDTAPNPDFVKNFEDALGAINNLTENLEAKRAKIQELKSLIINLEVSETNANGGILELTKERDEKIGRLIEKINKIVDLRERDLMIFTAAFSIGSVANELLRNEGILAASVIAEP